MVVVDYNWVLEFQRLVTATGKLDRDSNNNNKVDKVVVDYNWVLEFQQLVVQQLVVQQVWWQVVW